ncbi:MAG TPA: Virginiamycin B lyase, partial [Candidatus Eisenbacteria bacterium]
MLRIPLVRVVPSLLLSLLGLGVAAAQSITEFAIPTANAGPMGIARGADGALWFVENRSGRVGRVTVGGLVTDYPAATAASGPKEIAAGADGALWFTEPAVARIGRISLGASATDFPANGSGLGLVSPQAIAAGPDGRLWFTDGSGRIGAISTAGVVNAYPVPTSSPGLEGITAGPDGNLWFVENIGKIGRITPQGAVT